MKVQRFFAKNMAEALRQVREEFGPDAVILSNNRVDGGTELVAALDYEEDAPEAEAQVEPSQQGQPSPSQIARMHAEKHVKLQQEMERARRRIEDVRRKRSAEGARAMREQAAARQSQVEHDAWAAQPAEDAASQPSAITTHGQRPTQPEQSVQAAQGGWSELSDMKAEILELKNLISGQAQRQPDSPLATPATMSQAAVPADPSGVKQQVMRMLDSLCITRELAEDFARCYALGDDFDTVWSQVCAAMQQGINTEDHEIIDRQGVVALLGPTGSGKTMTIGKMAARYVMKYGAEGLALVTTDRYRIAAHEQLKVFGRILKVPVHVVDERNDLDSILNGLQGKKLVLVDTAGLMHNDACWSEQLQEIRMTQRPVKNYLVVPAVGQYQVMCATYQHYRMAGLAGVIVTKCDETVSLGEIISFLHQTGMPASYYTDGQRVPEDIHLVEAAALVERAEALLNSSERWVTIRSQESPDSNAYYFHTA